jgi:hypothetical protein
MSNQITIQNEIIEILPEGIDLTITNLANNLNAIQKGNWPNMRLFHWPIFFLILVSYAKTSKTDTVLKLKKIRQKMQLNEMNLLLWRRHHMKTRHIFI